MRNKKKSMLVREIVIRGRSNNPSGSEKQAGCPSDFEDDILEMILGQSLNLLTSLITEWL